MKGNGDYVSIKKILLFSCLVVIIPYIIVTTFIKKDEVKFNYISNDFVRVCREKGNKIEKVPLEEYVYGVVSSEMPATYEIEALKAQAVASRTYVMYQKENNKDKEFDVYDSVNSQVYKSDNELKEQWKDKYMEYSNRIKKVIIDTKGEYLTYKGQIIIAFFFSTSVGFTENSEDVFNEQLPYLRSVESKWDESSTTFDDTKKFSKDEFYNSLNISKNEHIDITDIDKSPSGRIKSLKINKYEFTGKEVRNKLGLKSTFFTFYEEGDNIIVKTKGYGHGVGMSQYGANGMAKEGYSYIEILKHYYTDVKIEKINN